MGKVLKNVSKISGVYGQPGEEKISNLLADNLPDDYIILNSPRVSYHGATIDIDHVVIGPNGIFAIESKNMHGKIFGGLMGNWTQERKKSGKNRRVKIGNPASQVNHYGKIVRSFLTVKYLNEVANKVNVKIYPIVVFVHEDANLTTMDYTKPGFVGRVRVLKTDELIGYILGREGVQYSEEDIRHFSELLVPSDQRDQTEYFAPGFLAEQKDLFSQRYEVYEEVGRGNFGSVYRGFDFKLDREVAIKKMHNKQNDPDAIKRFFREAQINAKLNNEHIVSVYDYYEEDGDYYLIMEFVDGETLEDFTRETTFEVSELYDILDPICSALEHAHQYQVIHRDLKPANILITADKKVKVSDFGIARFTEEYMVTQTAASVGTPSVMAPEQITGKKVDQRTDIFGLGILMFVLLTGEYPFKGEHIGELINRILHHHPKSISELNPNVPREIEAVVMKCLEKEPEHRFQSVKELRKALRCVFVEEKDYFASKGAARDFYGKRSRWLKLVPGPLKALLTSDKRLLRTITAISFIVIFALLSYQAYSDISRSATGYPQTSQYGFTNENLKALYSNPDKFKGVPVNVVGKIEKLINLTENTTMFTISVEGTNLPYKHLIVEYHKPHFMMQYAEYIKVVGSVKSTDTLQGNSTPVIIADKVEPMEDPWSILAPTVLTLHPNETKNYNGKVVQLHRVEFATRETRLFISVINYSDQKAYFVLSNPIGRQGNQVYKEVPNRYGVYSQATLELNPGEYVEEVIFLQPMDSEQKSGKFILGSDLNIADTEKPYVFDINW